MSKDAVRTFRALHHRGDVLLLPNAWDATTALLFEKAGFAAIATTSAGVAAALGYADGEVITFADLLFVVHRMMQAVGVPVSVDVEAGYGRDPAAIAAHVVAVAELGAAGVNVEDAERGGRPGLRSIGDACEILRAVRQALTRAERDLFVNARVDTYISGLCPADAVVAETIRRGTAYVAAGADGVFVPCVTDAAEIRALCDAIPAPVNVLALPGVTDAARLRSLGVARLSIGKAAYTDALAHAWAHAVAFRTMGDAAVFFDASTPVPSLDVARVRRLGLP